MLVSSAKWLVHKFGGTSVANADRYRNVGSLLKVDDGARRAVVVSAMSGVTNALIELVALAQSRDENYSAKLAGLQAQHLATLQDLSGDSEIAATFESDFKEISEVLRGIWLSRSDSESTTELISGYGEIWSAQLLNSYLKREGFDSDWLDARKVLVVTPTTTGTEIHWKESENKLQVWLSSHPQKNIVVTGFVASTPKGIPTTLKRNGSDYSASIFGALLKAQGITIWTDVDGILSADPRIVSEAVVLEELSYEEASELAYFGAKVVHPSTMAPAVRDKIPIWIRNTFNPTHPGSKIHSASANKKSSRPIKGFATIDNMALVNVEGPGMVGVPGVAQRLFGALREVGVSAVLISQASSEHSICFAIAAKDAATARSTLERAFYAELHQGQIQTISMHQPCSILAAVGDNMVDYPGVAGRFFNSLGKARVNIRAIAQGSSERNISAVIDQADAKRALNTVHSGFFLSPQTISIGIIGAGLIGGTFLDQLLEQSERLAQEYRMDLRIRGLMNSKTMLLKDPSISLSNWRDQVKLSQTPADIEAFARHIRADHLPHAVIIDGTASADVPKNYVGWLEGGIHVISPNKKANTASMAEYLALRQASRKSNKQFLYETNVGAGLPIINTLRDLVQTGDKIEQIDGVFSGTLSYIFNSYDGKTPFSQIVNDAKAKGFTEPDPRDDLSGMDVARKLVILSREMGQAVELSDINVESLVPKNLRDVSADEFLQRLSELDTEMSARFHACEKRGEVLRYVGVIPKTGKPIVELRAYSKDHAFAHIRGSDNIVSYKTQRYFNQPLIVQGPGAGPAVTAAGVFADLLRLASMLGDA